MDTAEVWWQPLDMTIILVLAVALVGGMIMQNRRALLLPLALGVCAALVIAASGHSLNDTPIPFLVVVSTLVMVGGQGLRSHGRRRAV
jgi:CHASE2 domain-containing sensor protein